ADDVEVARQVAGREGAVREDMPGVFPVTGRKVFFILDEMAQGVADRPGAAGVIFGEGVIVPADGTANREAVLVDASGGVMRCGDAAGYPVLEAVHFA